MVASGWEDGQWSVSTYYQSDAVSGELQGFGVGEVFVPEKEELGVVTGNTSELCSGAVLHIVHQVRASQEQSH